jgi:hypothetical protein
VKSFHFGPENLVKKTINIKDTDHFWHLVSYYRPIDVLQGLLQIPSLNQEFILQSWHRPGNSKPDENLSDDYRVGQSSVPPMMRLWDRSQYSNRHVQPTGPKSTGSAHFHIDALQDPFSGLGFADSGTVSASIDGKLDLS